MSISSDAEAPLPPSVPLTSSVLPEQGISFNKEDQVENQLAAAAGDGNQCAFPSEWTLLHPHRVTCGSSRCRARQTQAEGERREDVWNHLSSLTAASALPPHGQRWRCAGCVNRAEKRSLKAFKKWYYCRDHIKPLVKGLTISRWACGKISLY